LTSVAFAGEPLNGTATLTTNIEQNPGKHVLTIRGAPAVELYRAMANKEEYGDSGVSDMKTVGKNISCYAGIERYLDGIFCRIVIDDVGNGIVK
jgi:hypothetical protein